MISLSHFATFDIRMESEMRIEESLAVTSQLDGVISFPSRV